MILSQVAGLTKMEVGIGQQIMAVLVLEGITELLLWTERSLHITTAHMVAALAQMASLEVLME
ncbi:hypothetical protein LH86_17930 [Cedecea neteri]|nr:hypothetical protein LH86_17930 [Cedecea neteri]